MKTLNVCVIVLIAFLAKTKAVGNVDDMDSNAEELKPVLEFAELMLDRAVNSLYIHKIGSVLKAQKQIVSGVKYYLSFEFKETTCLRNKAVDGVCDITKTELCTAQVWSRPWLSDHKMQLLTFSCNQQ